jgi:RNA polymerase sigma-70 factor (ECF subfamily)
VSALHPDDLELARQCAAGDEKAWERFVRQYRPLLYRAADALEPGGGARELADSLYADLFGLEERDGQRRSLFRYFHGRSSLATWLRAVLAQRYVDHFRARRRLEPLPEDGSAPQRPADATRKPMQGAAPDPDRPRYLALMRQALARALAHLSARDRLRLGCYYVQRLTLAETGRLLEEHEATASRQLERTRRLLRADLENRLRDEGLNDAQIAECVASTTEDAGPLDLAHMLGAGAARKESAPDRSI